MDGVRMDGLVLDGRYRIGQQLGEGGMGAVYEAQDLRLERVVAVKVLHGVSLRRDPRARQRFEREAKLLAGLTSPFIVTVHDAGEAPATSDGGQRMLYLVMERLHGRSLDEVLSAGDLPSLRLLAQWGEQICRALGAAHDGGVIHRDLKPANVMVGTDGLVRVLDFGIASVVADSPDNHRLTSTGLVVGTPAYMAPEQIEGARFEKRTDLYALGCILYALVTGRPPFESDSLYTLMRQQMTRIPDAPSIVRPGVPNEWDALIMRLLAKQPEERPESAAEVLELLALLPCPDVAATPPRGTADDDAGADGTPAAGGGVPGGAAR
ncbi:serine/threonine-protein kinase, partial [Streptomyces sp. YIM 98790]|uniref:serine/threonine-protein kinase n=1 Tax=Streptomyces sp. YIM 98790 TaxID=2689077 RepID=UPI00140CE13F